MEGGECALADLYDARDYDFIRARLDDNPIYANDAEYRRTLEALPDHLRRAFLEGDSNVFAGQYFDILDVGRHTARPEEIRLEAWWPRWISIDWGFQHPGAVYWHCAVPVGSYRSSVFSQGGYFSSKESDDKSAYEEDMLQDLLLTTVNRKLKTLSVTSHESSPTGSS